MTDFYRLDLETRTERLRQLAVRALEAWGVVDGAPAVLKVRENAVFKVTRADGAPAVLRIHRHGYHTDAALSSELQWMEALQADGIAVPGVIPTRAGDLFTTVAVDGVPEPRQVDMLEWMPGETFGSIEKGLSPSITDVTGAFGLVGALAARLHNHTASWPLPAGFTRHAWDVEGLVGEAPLWGRFWEQRDLTADQRRLLEAARARVRRDLVAYGEPPRTYGLIHADFNLDNILLDGERVVLLDFDDAGFGWHQFDLATIWTLFRGAPYYDSMRAAVLAGYQRERTLAEEDLVRLPLLELARCFTYLGWVHTRSETATAQEIAPDVIALVCATAEDYLAGSGGTG